MDVTYKIIDGSSKKRIGKIITIPRPVSVSETNGIINEVSINIEFEGKFYGGMVTKQENYITALLHNTESRHGNANIKLTLEQI